MIQRQSLKQKSVLFFRGKRREKFFTEDSKLYITPREQELVNAGIKLDRSTKKWDSLSRRIVKNYQLEKTGNLPGFLEKDFLFRKLLGYRKKIRENLAEKSKSLWREWSLAQLWNFSLIGAILLGMISMTLIYKFLGPGALARNFSEKQNAAREFAAESSDIHPAPQILGAAVKKESDGSGEDLEYIERIIENLEAGKKEEFENKIRKMVKGYPIEKMLPYIIEKDRIVAAFLIGIARKESQWGMRVPVLNGQDCYNYWGYRGQRKLMGTGGHTCFNSRKDAVDTVAKRIDYLVKKQKLNTPDKMVIWKCGSACNKDDQAAVRKWVSDVNLYFKKLNN